MYNPNKKTSKFTPDESLKIQELREKNKLEDVLDYILPEKQVNEEYKPREDIK